MKASATIRPGDFRGLATLAEVAGDAFQGGALFYGGEKALPFSFGGRRFHALPLGMLLPPGRTAAATEPTPPN